MKKKLLGLCALIISGASVLTAQTNVAFGKAVTATRVTGGEGTPIVENDVTYLVDGVSLSSDGTEEIGRYVSWTRSEGGVNIDIDLGGSYNINSYKWYTASSNTATSYGGPVSDFTFQVWSDEANEGLGGYVIVHTTASNSTTPFEGTFAPVTTDRVRINSTDGNGGYVRYTEVEVFEAPTGFDGDEQIISVEGNFGAVLDNGANTISGVWPGETAGELLAYLSVEEGVVVEVLDGETNVDSATDLTSGMVVRTTSPFDGDTRDYTIALAGLTNIVSGVLPSLITTTDDGYEAHSGTSLAGITDGELASGGAGRWLYRVVDAGTQVRQFPVVLTFDFGSSININSFKLSEVKNASSYTFETWNGSGWDVQASVVANDNPQGFNGVSNVQISSGTFETVSTTMVRIVITDNTCLTDSEDNRYLRMHELEIFGESALSVDDISFAEFKMYPNPVYANYLYIEGGNLNKIKKVEVFNLLGNKIPTSFYGDKVDVSGLSAGLYVLRLNNSKTLKFVKK